MYREYVKEARSEKRVVRVDLMTGCYLTGVIENSGPEALLLRTRDGENHLILKTGVAHIGPVPAKKDRKA